MSARSSPVCRLRQQLWCCIVFSLLKLISVTGKGQVQLAPRRLLQQLDELSLVSRYDNNEELEHHMQEIAKQCGSIAHIIQWGQSAKGQKLLALELYAGDDEPHSRPGFKYVGNLHGDEPTGRQLLLALAEHLCKAHRGKEPAVLQLLRTVSLVLIPSANPDGWDMKRRENSHGIDLNRNYPDPVLHKGHDLRLPLGQEQPETLAMMNLTLSRRFVGSLALHEGALVANYPFDGYADGSHELRGKDNPSADDATFKHLAKEYARLHTTMAASREFPSGITNGAHWYPVYGGMQDWNYLAAGCLEVTLELNDDKHPDPQRLALMWLENRQAMVEYPALLVLGGLRGSVKSAESQRPLVASIHVVTQGYNVTSGPRGDFYRPLAPGHYTVLVEAPGHLPANASVEVPSGGAGHVLNIALQPLPGPPPPPAPAQGTEAEPAKEPTAAGHVPVVTVLQVSPHLSWLHVLLYVVVGPLLVWGAFVSCRSGHLRRLLLEPLLSLLGRSSTQKFHAIATRGEV